MSGERHARGHVCEGQGPGVAVCAWKHRNARR